MSRALGTEAIYLGGHSMKAFALLFVLTFALVFSSFAVAASTKHYVPHKSFAKMTLHEKESWYAKQAHHDRGAIRWLTHHLTAKRSRLILSPGDRARLLGAWRVELRWFSGSLRTVTKKLAVLKASEVPLILRERGLPNPPAWFLSDIACIERGESTDGAGSSNLFGMLQGWYAAGGTDNPDAWHASYEEQLDRTWILYNMFGWSPWSTAPGCGL